MRTTIALFGAAGNMGTRISNTLKNDPRLSQSCTWSRVRTVKRSSKHAAFPPSQQKMPSRQADVAILAVPDALIGKVAHEVVPAMKSGSMLICLDPAAPYGGKLPTRADVTYFVTHPAHPPVFNDEKDEEARRDFFGSGKAKQSIVNALMQGPESDYAKGETISRKIFGPILRSHRVTVDQMAMLEPALSETVAADMHYNHAGSDGRGYPARGPRGSSARFSPRPYLDRARHRFQRNPLALFPPAPRKPSKTQNRCFSVRIGKKVFEEKHLRDSVERITSGH
jgi:hypothetical protein